MRASTCHASVNTRRSFFDANIWTEGSLVHWWREQWTNLRAMPLDGPRLVAEEPNRSENEATRLPQAWPTFSRDAATSAGITAAIVATVDDDTILL